MKCPVCSFSKRGVFTIKKIKTSIIGRFTQPKTYLMDSKEIGKRAEERALNLLSNQGYELCEKNYRYKRSEIDLIVRKSQTLVFIEVKYRRTTKFGHPEEFVSANQKRSILEGAEHYITEIGWQHHIRFDIIAVDAAFNIEHFQDAFY